jgi:hypothetical protein
LERTDGKFKDESGQNIKKSIVSKTSANAVGSRAVARGIWKIWKTVSNPVLILASGKLLRSTSSVSIRR